MIGTHYKIMLVGEAWGEKEEEAKAPFVGTSGWLLKQLLSQSGISYDECAVTNVFNLRPKPTNDISNLCGPKVEGLEGYPSLIRGKYCRAEYAPELSRLYTEIAAANPNLILALGATASWALLLTSGIKSIRGFITPTAPAISERLGRTYKVLPTYHPAAVTREWGLRPTVLADMDKAVGEAEFPEIIRPNREIWIEPTLLDLATYDHEYILPATRLSIDIETIGHQITCIGFAPSDSSCIVIPFHTKRQTDGNYWRTLQDELIAWSYVREWCAMKPTVFQNGIYDMQILWRIYGIPCPLADEDTMLMHHAFQPELEKGLGYLASIYCNEVSWKRMARGVKHD